jgi:MFS transporter, DHA1 family, inner membrane transport protein
MTPGSSTWQVIASSSVLSLALLGDALIYAVLPVHAQAFGVSLVWVGILLSANRFVRVFAYGLVAQITTALGPRRMCIAAAIGAVVSTAVYGVGEGEFVLLLARALWGIAYAILVLVTLAYAVEERAGAGARVGWSRAIQRVGPIIALLGGAWLTQLVGPRMVFVVLAGITLLAIPLAMGLPRDAPIAKRGPRPPALGRPRTMDSLFFLQGMGVDGVFALTITLILAEKHSLSVAVLSGGALLAMRHVGEAVAAPLFGMLGDRFGAARVFAVSVCLTAIGFLGVAAGFTVAGALLMLVFRGALASLGPATIVQATAASDSVMAPLARMLAWRDLGAAVGPLMAGALVGFVSPQLLHGAVAAAMFGTLLWWFVVRARAHAKLTSRGSTQ